MRVGRLVSLSFAAFTFCAKPAWADTAWTIPGIVNTAGLNGTHFVSDLTVTNPGAGTAHVTLSLFPSGSSPKAMALAPGQTVVSSDVASSLFGVSGAAGALSVSSDQPLLIRAKTYNASQTGTYGVALPVVPSDRLLAPGDVGNSLWISQDRSGNAGYRTNVAVVFPDASGGAATVTVYDADGNQRGQQEFSLDTPGLQQFSVGSFAGAVSVARAQVAVTRGHASAYAVVVDNVTGDSSLFAFEDPPGGRTDVLLNGVARANGRNAAFFRTDGRFYNPTDTDAKVTVAFHASGNANPSPQSAQFVVPAGKIRDVVDVLDSLLGLPVGSAGALRFQSNWPVAILCRTSNVDPSGARPGTFGSQQKPVPLLSFVTSADVGAAVTGIRQNSAFRTNVGFAAGADGASYTLTLATKDGATVATTSASLGVFGWTQPGIQDLFPTTPVPESATLTVKVTSGSLDVFDSSIDNLSGDPVVTPIAPIPAAIPSGATIGPAGGSIRSEDGRLTLRVPAGALASPVALSLQTTTNDAPQGTGPGYQLSPSNVTFAKPALLTLAYGRAETESSSAEALAIAVRTETDWHILGGGAVDPARHSLTVSLLSASPAGAARSQARQPAADGQAKIAVAKSWELVPTGRRAVVAGGQLPFGVYVVGGSSSMNVGDLLTGTLSTSPEEVEADWFVGRWLSGLHPEDGVIVPTGAGGNLSVVYQAPACPPDENPIPIQAHISNVLGRWSKWYSVTGYAYVRVLPRKWILSVLPDYTLSCGGIASFSDHIAFKPESATVQLTLNDDLSFPQASNSYFPNSHFMGPCGTFCPGTPSLTKGTADTRFTVTVSGRWDVEGDKMVINAAGDYPGLGGSTYFCKTDAGPTVPVPLLQSDDGFAFKDDGVEVEAELSTVRNPQVTGKDASASLQVGYHLAGVCP